MTVTRGSIDTRMFNAINEKTKQIWFQTGNDSAGEGGIHLAGGISNTQFSTSTPNTWGFNTFIANGGLKLRYNQIDLATLSTNALAFYKPNVTSGAISGSVKAMELGTSALTFYSPSSTNNNNLKKLMELTSDSLNFYDKDDSTNPIAKYNGSGILLGKESAGNVLVESGGVYVRDGLREVATFGADGQTFNNEYSRAVFTVGYLERQRFNGKYNSFAYDGTSPFVFSLPWDVNSIINVKYYDSTGAQVEDIPLHSGYTLDGRTVTIDATTCALMNTYGVTRVLVYYSATGVFPFFIFGDPGAEALGIMSAVMGDNCVASGYFSFAGGEGAIASGAESFAYGERPTASGIESAAFGRNTVAAGNYQFVCGQNNANDQNNIFEIGNGVTKDSRRNAFSVGKSNGNVTALGTITAEGHTTAIGYKTGRKTGTYSLATGTTFVTVPASALSRITLSEGTWIIHAHAAFESNNTGRRAMRIYSVTSSEGLTRSFVTQTATNGAATNMNTMAIVDVGSTDITYTIQLTQNSGSAKSVDLILEAVRIA